MNLNSNYEVQRGSKNKKIEDRLRSQNNARVI
jgi:hypothetical protein